MAVEKREKGEEKKQGPSVNELVEKETVDELPYIGWVEKEKKKEKVTKGKLKIFNFSFFSFFVVVFIF